MGIKQTAHRGHQIRDYRRSAPHYLQMNAVDAVREIKKEQAAKATAVKTLKQPKSNPPVINDKAKKNLMNFR